MANFQSRTRDLPPEERLKLQREAREKRQQELEQELDKKKKELQSLEEEKKREEDMSEREEDESLEELTRASREEEIKRLEEHIRRFQEDEDFIPEGGEVTLEEAVAPQPTGERSERQYQDPLQQAHEGLQYLIHGAPSEQRQREVASSIYQRLHVAADNFSQGRPVDESEFYQLQKDLGRLPAETPYRDNITNFLNQIVDYRSEEERRRQH